MRSSCIPVFQCQARLDRVAGPANLVPRPCSTARGLDAQAAAVQGVGGRAVAEPLSVCWSVRYRHTGTDLLSSEPMELPAHFLYCGVGARPCGGGGGVAGSGGGDPGHIIGRRWKSRTVGRHSPPGEASGGAAFGSHWIGGKSAVVLPEPVASSDSSSSISSPPSRLLARLEPV